MQPDGSKPRTAFSVHDQVLPREAHDVDKFAIALPEGPLHGDIEVMRQRCVCMGATYWWIHEYICMLRWYAQSVVVLPSYCERFVASTKHQNRLNHCLL